MGGWRHIVATLRGVQPHGAKSVTQLTLTSLPFIIMAACDSGAENGQEPNEEALTEAAKTTAQAFVDGDAAKFYSFMHDSFKQKCSLGEFTPSFQIVRSSYGEGIVDAEVKVIEVRVDGNQGFIDGDIYFNGRGIGFDDDDPNDITDDQPEDSWLWEDGRWWMGAFNPNPAPCPAS